MRNLVYLLLLVSPVFWAQNAFEKGNQFYARENYEQAVIQYEGILASGKQSAEVYFNLGNSYYKLHKVAPAIYNYEKALQLSPNDAEIQTNLDFARKMAIDEIKFIPKVGFKKLIADFTSKYHYNSWAWITVALAFVFLLFFTGYYYASVSLRKRIFFSGMLVVLILIGIAGFAAFFEKNRLSSERPAIVFAETTALKSEPRASAPDTFILHEGAKVYLLESIANWKKVQLTDETTGWVASETLKELN